MGMCLKPSMACCVTGHKAVTKSMFVSSMIMSNHICPCQALVMETTEPRGSPPRNGARTTNNVGWEVLTWNARLPVQVTFSIQTKWKTNIFVMIIVRFLIKETPQGQQSNMGVHDRVL